MAANQKNLGYIYAISAAILFGASTPAAKYLLVSIDPWLLAGLLYLGSGFGLLIVFIIQFFFKSVSLKEAKLESTDWKWLGGATLSGGIIGPIFLMMGLVNTDAASASLLLNLEMVFTVICAWLIFKEHVSQRITIGMLFIVLGSSLLSWKGHFEIEKFIGALLISGACFAWAFDNNLTRKISAANPIQIAMIKCLVAGLTNTILAVSFGSRLLSSAPILSASLVGFVGYGISLLFFIMALRHIGTSRTSAYFSISPFIGSILAITFLHEPVTVNLLLAGIFMGFGIWLHLTEKHEHEHTHEALEHSHKHVHDEHHQHEHLSTDPKGEPHTHWHKHKPLRHSHPHYPDIHHRHNH